LLNTQNTRSDQWMLICFIYIPILLYISIENAKYTNANYTIFIFCLLRLENVYYVTFIEQKGECIIRYFGRPCDEFAERVWPIKISDGARVTLFNKGLVSCDVNQSFLILLFE
jgi:hypothetical protein